MTSINIIDLNHKKAATYSIPYTYSVYLYMIENH